MEYIIVFLPLVGAILSGFFGKFIGHRISEILTSLFVLISGLLLASLLRKPTMEGQTTMDSGEFKKMDKNTVCFEGDNPRVEVVLVSVSTNEILLATKDLVLSFNTATPLVSLSSLLTLLVTDIRASLPAPR